MYCIHHLNGNFTDNDLSNLALVDASNPGKTLPIQEDVLSRVARRKMEAARDDAMRAYIAWEDGLTDITEDDVIAFKQRYERVAKSYLAIVRRKSCEAA